MWSSLTSFLSAIAFSKMSYSQLTDAFARGNEYLRVVQSYALEPGMVDIENSLWGYYTRTLQSDQIKICTWIGNNISQVNAQLEEYLQACHECFHPQERHHIKIFGAPLAQSFGIDGLCNILSKPIIILIDVGRIAPEDWLSLVAHEYAHAHVGNAGHNQQFADVLHHLCLGLNLEPPTDDEMKIELKLRSWPYCRSTQNPLAFWMGEM
ncbi:hypothetical protein [Calothrix sp. PCC 6303]|uniref:hypothetical protein n=1 Tax=Calothrix sp. PCC 6303 TaxID=1170562 RepID=UPI001EEF9253|nr:hypothetical protein [Calothrix sp. PCC 6303]